MTLKRFSDFDPGLRDRCRGLTYRGNDVVLLTTHDMALPLRRCSHDLPTCQYAAAVGNLLAFYAAMFRGSLILLILCAYCADDDGGRAASYFGMMEGITADGVRDDTSFIRNRREGNVDAIGAPILLLLAAALMWLFSAHWALIIIAAS